MKAIVVAGHSAGGQFVNRYEMSNSVHDTLGVPVSYVVANPSSYAWPDADPGAAGGRCVAGECGGRLERRDRAHEVHVRPVRCEQGSELRPLADRSGEPHGRLHREALATNS